MPFWETLGMDNLWGRQQQFSSVDHDRILMLLWRVPNTHAHRGSTDWTWCIIKRTKRISDIGNDVGCGPGVAGWGEFTWLWSKYIASIHIEYYQTINKYYKCIKQVNLMNIPQIHTKKPPLSPINKKTELVNFSQFLFFPQNIHTLPPTNFIEKTSYKIMKHFNLCLTSQSRQRKIDADLTWNHSVEKWRWAIPASGPAELGN